MTKLLEVREFDKITCNPDFKDEYAYLPEKIFNDLKEFIHVFAADEEHADALAFLKIGFRRNVGYLISVSNYVGLIQMKNGYQIQVLPKIDFGTNPDSGNEETKRVFIRMLRSMKDFPSKVFNDANLKIDRMTLYDIFINMYLQNVRTLIKHAIKSAYVVREGNLNFFKGKLVVSEQIKRNIAHGERFYVRYDEYLVDRAENRLVKATLLKLQEMTSSSENQKEIRQLLTAFEMVEASTNIQEDFVHVVIDRNTKDYDVLMQWSKVFLLNKSFTTFSGDQNAVALLFPMEKVFESYVTQQLKKTLLDLNWNVSSQDKGYYLFDSPQQFALRPDIVITRNDGSKIILDTKWKSLVDDQRVNYGILQSDMYQMYAYSKKYEAPEVWLLYPLNEEMRDHPEISLGSRDGVSVRLFFVDVANIEENLSKLRSLLIAQ
ncbi:MAG: McrC family protein [Synergistaceae bacterium]|nr:McrC family protein [Synergistaceae bacterium]MBQ6417905.1 McrC family protein [Synergistaceae bacterium]MBQ6666023.1 McrC family protein [Synergistaceae bacterium]MBR0186846.1 McrC family protein [Synergistaceae bacterium]